MDVLMRFARLSCFARRISASVSVCFLASDERVTGSFASIKLLLLSGKSMRKLFVIGFKQ